MSVVKVLGILFLFLFTSGHAFAGGNVINEVTSGVCECLEACKKEEAQIQGRTFQTCIQKVAKPHIKELKKMYLDKNDPNAEEKFATKIAMQLGVSMADKCPDMLEFIMEEFPELQDGN
jgi:hypothetical protein